MLSQGKFGRSRVTGGDPYWSSTQVLLHGDGERDDNVFVDSTGKTSPTEFGGVLIKPQQAKFGDTSMWFPGSSNNRIIIADSAALRPGAGDFTVEAWIHPLNFTNFFGIAMKHNESNAGWQFYCNASGLLCCYIAATGGDSSATISANTWTHVAMSRTSGVLKLFKDGVQCFSATRSTSLTNTNALHIGYMQSGYQAYGYIDDFRYTVGVGRYTANFTPAAAPYPDF